VSRYRFVSTMKAEGFPIDAACEAAEVSTSAYYEWLQRAVGPTEGELDEAYLVNRIVDIHAESDSTYGSPRVTKELRRRGYCVNHKRTERLMSKHAIVGVTPRRRTPRTTMAAEGAPPLPVLVNQDFSPGEPDRRWAGDLQCRHRHWMSYADHWTMPMLFAVCRSSGVPKSGRSA